jgi:cell cycle checkpoint control protein RAD9A
MLYNRSTLSYYMLISIQALLSIFRARSGDPLHEHDKDTTIERCDVAVEDDPEKASRFVVKILCRNGT